MKLLSIETSCDDTSISILEDDKVVILNTISQNKRHNLNGGVIPENASRLHLDNIFDLIKKTLIDANCQLNDLNAIAVTKGPGLVNSLQVGIVVAKTLANILQIPLYGINHLDSHIYSAFINKNNFLIEENDLALVASGGHTILAIFDGKNFKQIGNTLDDAVGEAFDKVGKALGFEYPSGQIIDDIFQKYNGEYFEFPTINMEDFNFSYSGLKTFTFNLINKFPNQKEKIAASFQKNAMEQIFKKIEKAIKEFKPKNFIIGGGVTANSYLREKINSLENLNIFIPEKKYTQDNAAMIGWTAFYLLKNNKILPSDLKLDANPILKLGE